MIPEIEKNNTLDILRKNLHLSMRRRTWRFKRNGRLNSLVQQVPVRRRHTLWNSVVPVLLGLLMCRG